MHAGLKVAVPGKDAGGDEIVIDDRFFNRGGQGTRITDAGCATIANEVKAELIEVGLETGSGEVIGDDARAGSKGGFDGGVDGETPFDRFFGQKPSGKHDGGVGGIGAGGNGGNDDGAVVQGGGFCGGSLGEEIFGDMIRGRALGDQVEFIGGQGEGGGAGASDRIFPIAPVGEGLSEERIESGFERRQFNPILRTFGPGDAGADGGEVELDDGGEGEGIFLGGDSEKILGAVVVGHELDEFGGATRTTEVGEGFLVDGEVAHGGAVFWGHVGDGGPIGQGKFGGAGSIKLNELTDDFVLAENLGNGEGEICGGGSRGEFAGEVNADDFGGEEGERLAKHARLGLNAADAPTDDAEAIDHGGVGIRADEGVGVGEGRAIGLFLGKDASGKVFQINLMNDADAGGDDAEGGKSLLAPFEKFVAFAITFKFVLHVKEKGLRGAVDIDLDRVVHDEVDGDERFDEFGVFLQAHDGVAHGGEVN